MVELIQGGLSVDDRGIVSFVNEINFSKVKRIYAIENHAQGFVRAWHAHKKEEKFVMVVRGSVLVGTVKIENWDTPNSSSEIERHVLSDRKPSILHIPGGYGNGFKTLTDNAKVLFFSTSTLEESKQDDFRYPARYFDIWKVEER